MINTKLSDFTEEQLRMMLRAVLAQRKVLEEHVKSLQPNAYLELLFAEKIREYESEIEQMNEVEVQLSYAVQTKVSDRIVISN